MKIESAPQKGFHWAYYLYIPGSTGATPGREARTYLLVEPNNTGQGSDDYGVHDSAAKKMAERRSPMAEALRIPLLVPTFPRPQTEWQLYTQALDRDTLLTQKEGLKRLDLQLIAMIDDARQRLLQKGISLEKKVLMSGFSASGMFVSRFAALHPGLVQAAAIGQAGGWPIAPVSEWKGVKLRYPIGVWDLKQIAGSEFDIEAFKSVPLYVYLGDQDKEKNDAVPGLDAYEPEDKELIFQYFGDNPVKRWPKAEEIYKSAGCSAQFVLYPGIGHEITREITQDIGTFFLNNLAPR